MNKIKQSFSDFRKSIPRGVQWLLLIVAFVVVIVLMFILLGNKSEQTVAQPVTPTVLPTLTITPDSIDWTMTAVGDTARERISITSDNPVRIDNIRHPDSVRMRTTCENMKIDDMIPCTIDVEYSPTTPSAPAAVSLFIDWRPADDPLELEQTEKLIIAIGAIASLPEPEPIIELEPFIPELPEPIPTPEPAPELPAPVVESCSDFAFGGYDSAGRQIGWIRPDAGRYLYYPFADIHCTNPTGVYNPDNGIITDINNPAVRIGTDAENIGYTVISNGTLPTLSNAPAVQPTNRARQLTMDELIAETNMAATNGTVSGGSKRVFSAPPPEKIMTSSGAYIVSSAPYDRTFILRQYKPIPATIVSEIRAEQKTAGELRLPVIATVDRNVYSDNGRTIIVPTGTTLYGFVKGDVPGPYKAIGRMQIEWYQFVRPDGVEFNFTGNNPFSGDAQGRAGVPGRGSTDYWEQFVMPMLTAIVPAAVNMIAPISDRFINQIDLDNNTVTQSGQVRSSELAKNEIITAWNQVAQKLLVDMMDNTVPPFSIAAGTRINVFSPVDLLVTCGAPDKDRPQCAVTAYPDKETNESRRYDSYSSVLGQVTMGATPENAGSLAGQVRSFNLQQYCDTDTNGYYTGNIKPDISADVLMQTGYDYRTVVFYCQSLQYQAINNAQQAAIYQNQQQTTYTDPSSGQKMQIGSKEYNENVLGLEYNADGTIKNPYQLPKETPPASVALTCEDGTPPDSNGCCTGEVYTDMAEQGFNCCPDTGGDCFPPII